LTILLSSIK